MSGLTTQQIRALRSASIEPPYTIRSSNLRGFDRINFEMTMASLVNIHLAEPSPHGDWYLTEAGRAALVEDEPDFKPGEAEAIVAALEPQIRVVSEKLWDRHPKNQKNRN